MLSLDLFRRYVTVVKLIARVSERGKIYSTVK